ncbi:hypothetical protein D593_0657 [Streptococcus intermedius BA1]|nr:hypothetical protein D593_0657 [Streptococcus intermedius BA1]
MFSNFLLNFSSTSLKLSLPFVPITVFSKEILKKKQYDCYLLLLD